MFNLITPCSRPNNLKKIYESIEPFIKSYEIKWYIIYDAPNAPHKDWLPKEYVIQSYFQDENSHAGHSQRNFALNLITDGFVYQLDDDTIMHPDFFPTLTTAIHTTKKKGYIFNQHLRNGSIREAEPEQVKVTRIDNGQFLLHRTLIQDIRYDLGYEGDGIFIELIYSLFKSQFYFLKQPLCYYNLLR